MKAIQARFLFGLLVLALSAPLAAQGAANLSLTATVTANSEYTDGSTPAGSYDGPKAADNNLATWWNAFTDSASLPDNLYELRLDFGSDKPYSRIEIDKRGGGEYDYTIDWSMDGTTWFNLVTDHTIGDHSANTGTPVITHTFPPQTSRYVRFRSGMHYVALNEFRVFEPVGPYEAAVLADAPALFYRCNETGGATAANSGSLGAAANGSYEGGVTLGDPPAKEGLATAAALSGGSIRVPDLGLGGLTQFSLEFWFRRNSEPAPFFAIYADDGWEYGSLHLNLFDSGAPLQFAVNGNPNFPVFSPGWLVGEWQHVVVTYDTATSEVRFYLNGTLFSSAPAGATPIPFNGGRIGAWNSERFLDGSIDEVALYTHVLSPARVLAHFNSVQDGVGIATPPVDATVLEGRTASFGVVATGPNAGFQWYRNGQPIPGANAASYTTPPTSLIEDGDIFFVEVTNTVNRVTSSDAILNVAARPVDGYQVTVLGDAPLVFYRFNEVGGPSALNLGTLGPVADGTYGGAFTLGAAAPSSELGTALDLTQGYVQVPGLGQGGMTQATVELWLNRRSNPVDFFALFACNGWASGQLHWNLVAGAMPVEFAVAGNPVQPRFTPTWASGEWHHLVATYDASSGVAATVRFYFDGAFFGQASTGATPIDFAGGLVGAWTWGDPAAAARYLDGQVDEFAIYNTILNPGQVLRHFAAAAPPPPPYAAAVLTDNPAVYYRFEESAGTVAENLGTLGEAANGTHSAAGVTLGEASAYAALGKAVSLDGSSGTVRVPDLQFGPMSGATIECWLKRVNPPAGLTALWAGDGFELGDLHVNFPGSGPELEFAVPGNSFPMFAPAWAANEWHHLALTYSPPGEPGKVRCYLDGALAGTADTEGTPLEFTGGQIGAWLNTFASPAELQRLLTGVIDEFAIYPSALPPERVLAHFAAIPDTRAAITRDPVDAMVLEGQSAIFTVAAQGPGLGYQWFKNGVALADANAASYTTPPATLDDDGAVYFVQVSNAVNDAISSDAILTVIPRPTAGYEATVLADAPLVYYRFSETSGSTVANSGSLGVPVNGACLGGVTLGVSAAQGSLGTAVELDGASGVIRVPDLGNGAMAQLTVEFWLLRRANAAGLNAILASDFWTAGALHLNLAEAGSRLEFAVNPYPTPPRFTPSWPVDTWHHVAVTFDSALGQVTVYLDGSVVGSASAGTQPVSFTGGQIGAWLNTFLPTPESQRFLKGAIDEFAIYGSALSHGQVLRHYGAALAVAPRLTTTRVGNQLQLSWEGTGFVLHENADLTDPAGWTPVTGGSTSPVDVNLDEPHKFYRLISQ